MPDNYTPETVEAHGELIIQLYATISPESKLAQGYRFKSVGCVNCLAFVLAYECHRSPHLAQVIRKAAEIAAKNPGL